MTKHCCDKQPSYVDFWWLDDGIGEPSFTLDMYSRCTGYKCKPVDIDQKIKVRVDFCPWCGERLVRDDD